MEENKTTMQKISDGAKAVWNFLDGKKTYIGTAMLMAATVLPKETTAYYICAIGGELFGGIGFAHKANKAEALRLLMEGLKKVAKK